MWGGVINYIRRNRQIIILTVFPIIFIAMFIIIIFYYRTNERNILESYTNKLRDEYNFTIDSYSNTADLIFLNDINKDQILEIILDAKNSKTIEEEDLLRNKLYAELIGLYTNLIPFNFRQLHFHTADNLSFLRFHKPEKYGDDLTDVRYSVEYVNRLKKKISGFEEGRIFNGYRNVYPIFFKNEYLGSVELSVSMGVVVEQIHRRLDQQSDFIILKSAVESKVFNDELVNYSEWTVDNRFYLDNNIAERWFERSHLNDDDVSVIRSMLTESLETGKAFAVLAGYRNSESIVGFLPIKNFIGETVAYIFTLTDSGKLLSHKASFRIIILSFILLVISYTVFIVYMIITDKKIERMVTYDLLTDVYSRRMIFSQIEREFNRFIRYKNVFSVCMIDIDHFKKVNDIHGHQVGDSVLAELVNLIKSRIRVSDSLGRYGGEEFILLLPETDLESAFILVDKLRIDISKHMFSTVGKVTISAGLSLINPEISGTDELIKIADTNLYLAKQRGRNICVS